MSEDALLFTEISALELQARQGAGEVLALLDVREAFELELASLEGALHCPLSDFVVSLERLALDPKQKLVVFCHHGRRSVTAAQHLSEVLGFSEVMNLTGGIDAWSLEVDSSVSRY